MFGEHFMERAVMGYRIPPAPPAEFMEACAELLSRSTPNPPPAAVPTLEAAFDFILGGLWADQRNHDLAEELDALRQRIVERLEAGAVARREALQAQAEALRTSCREKLDLAKALVIQYNKLRSGMNEIQARVSEARVQLQAAQGSRPAPAEYPTESELATWRELVKQAREALAPWEEQQRALAGEMQGIAGQQATAGEELAKLAEEERLVRMELEGIPLPGPFGLQPPSARR